MKCDDYGGNWLDQNPAATGRGEREVKRQAKMGRWGDKNEAANARIGGTFREFGASES
jgi:hypothetical protein